MRIRNYVGLIAGGKLTTAVVTNSYLCAGMAVDNCPLQHYDFFPINASKLARDISDRKSQSRLKSIKDKEEKKYISWKREREREEVVCYYSIC